MPEANGVGTWELCRTIFKHILLPARARLFPMIGGPREGQEMVFDAHARAFAFFGGVPNRGIYDSKADQ